MMNMQVSKYISKKISLSLADRMVSMPAARQAGWQAVKHAYR